MNQNDVYEQFLQVDSFDPQIEIMYQNQRILVKSRQLVLLKKFDYVFHQEKIMMIVIFHEAFFQFEKFQYQIDFEEFHPMFEYVDFLNYQYHQKNQILLIILINNWLQR
eukprot:TRINITY_DN849_c0_g3_i1.p8 TRINITY_DN849_c0_g3~~TRINITY_DN849_c0_g3_i1.p8  ORF type:complete len:109 (-),score=4.70 TRINITY_DN849_c0_g3_i1:229-555(-)